MTRSTPALVSVVIPAYNAEQFIERTLVSALRQTYQNFELLIIDDGSRDKTMAIATSVTAGDDRVRIISVPNGGVASARNIGINEAIGPFVAFLDADDLWHPNKIQLQVAALTNRDGEDAAAAYGLMRLIDTADRVVGREGHLAGTGYTFARHLYARPVGNGSSLLVHREIALGVGGFDPSWAARGIGGCEDLDFELKICAKYPMIAIPLYLVGYRVSPGNMSSDGLRMARAVLATLEHHIQINPQLPAWAARKARDSTREYAIGLLSSERRWDLVSAELMHLLGSEPGRALEFTARLIARKVRKSLRSGQARPTQNVPPLNFLDLASESVVELRGRARRPRDQRNLDKLAELDAVLATKATSLAEYAPAQLSL